MPRGRPRHDDILTPREWEVLSLLRQGLSNQQIADELQISESGARYHVSEIISKLGVGSRQEAAAWQPPLKRLLPALLATKLMHRTLAGGLIGASFVLLLLLAAGLYVMERRRPADVDVAAMSAEADGSGRALTVAGGPVPSPAQIIRDGDPVGFRICSQTTNWQRPQTPNEVFADSRFGKDGKPTPSSYFLYRSDFFDVPTPDSASINKYMFAVTGILEDQPGATVVEECNPGTMYRSGLGMTHTFNLLDHRLVDAYRQDDHYVLVVEDLSRSWQAAYLPYPPDNSTYQRNFDSVQIVDTAGRLLFREQAMSRKGSLQLTRYALDGSIEAATFSPGSTALIPELKVLASSSYSIYEGFEGFEPLEQIPGSVTVRHAGGTVFRTVTFEPRQGMWDELARFELPPGTYTLEFSNLGTDSGRQNFLLLRDDQPLP